MKKKNNLIFWLLVIFVLALLGWGASKLANTSAPLISDAEILKIQANDWVKGDPNAKVILIGYSDFQCPACKTAAFYGQQLSADSSNLNKEVAIVFRHFPLESIHPNAKLAAQAAEAAGLQNKFWEMHDFLFEEQSAWSESNSAEKLFIDYAKKLDLDTDKFKNDLYSGPVKDKVNGDMKQGSRQRLNIQYTPTIYINGELTNLPNSYDKFRQLLQDKLGQ